MALPEKIVVDTSAFYALISAADEFHSRAEANYEVLKDRDVELWTTSYVLSETVALVHRRLGFDTLSQLLEIVEKDLAQGLRYAVLWGNSGKFDGQHVGRSHQLTDRDIIELHT